MKNLKLLSKIALSFQNLNNFDRDIEEALQDIGNLIDISRIYVFLNESGDVVSNTFEWCNVGVTSHIKDLQKIKYENIMSLKKVMEEDGYICSDDIMNLPQEIIDILEPQGIKSLVVYPLIIRNKIIGFIGFDECRYTRQWKAEELEILSTVSGLIASTYEKSFFQQELINSENNFQNFFEINPLPMAIINIDERKFIKANSASLEKTGYTRDEVIGKTIEELDIILNPDQLKAIYNKRINKEKIRDEEIVIKCKDGSLLIGEFSIEEISNQGKRSLLIVIADITLKKQAENALKESEKRFSLALEKTKAGLWDMDMVNGDVFLSPMWKSILGYEDDEIENSYKAWKQLWHPDDKDSIQKAMDDYLEGQSQNYEVIHRLKHKDGNWRWMSTSGGMLRDDSGAPYRWIGTHTDITTEYEQSLELESFFSINLDLLCILDKKGNFIKTNKAWEDVLGYSSDELQTHNFLDFVHKDDTGSTLEVIKKFGYEERIINFTNKYVSIDGYYHDIEWRLNPYEGVVYAAARDITERIEYENKLLEVSNRDALTNVYNRRYTFNRVREIIQEHKRTGKSFSLCIVDIDHFKKINDKYGHQTGDWVLKDFTRIIDEGLRPYDILGRYGGEEFLIVLNNIDGKQSMQVIERILNTIRNEVFEFNDEKIKFTFSAGIIGSNEIGKDEITIERLVEIADKRMYEAKNTGRNKIVYIQNSHDTIELKG